MPSGTDFKYSTGDTTAWKSKYYAFVDYALSIGASVADIEAFLAENSSFNPGTAPTALASLNAVNATTSDNLEYQVTHGTPYTSVTANLWFLVRMPSANTGAMTLKVDALAAKAVYFAGAATTGGEFSSGLLYVLAYNASSDRFDAFGPQVVPTMGLRKVTVHTSNGTHNFQSWARRAWVEVIGGGGGGGRSGSGGVRGIPGAGGGYAAKFIDLTGVSSATITVGGGGAGGTSTNGGNGGSSSYADGTNTLTGNGGAGGAGHSTNGATGISAGGTAAGGDMNHQGSYGGHEHTRGTYTGAAYMASGEPNGIAAVQPGAGGGTGYGTGSGAAGFRGEVRIWEYG